MCTWKNVLRGWEQPGSSLARFGAGGVLLALLLLSPALARAATTSGTTTPIASGNVSTPAFEAPFVAWVDGTSGDVIYYDQRDGSTHDIGPGSQPAVGDGQIVFICGSDKNVCAYDPATQQTTTMTSDSNDGAPGLSSELLAWTHADSPQDYAYVHVMDRSTHQTVSLPMPAIALSVHGSLVMYELESGSPEQSLALYDQSTGSTQGIASASDGFYGWGFDGTHIMYSPVLACATCGEVTYVTDLSANIIASIPEIGTSISGEWIPLFTWNSGASSLNLWRWTTGDVFSTNAPPPEGWNGGLPTVLMDGATVVEDNSTGQDSSTIDSFAFGSVPSSTVSFSDNFDACTSTTDLGPNWTINGTWYCKAQHARGEQTRDLALANTVGMQDTDVSALVQLNEDDMSGVAVRAQGDSYYAARLRSSNYVELIRVNRGTVQVLAAYPTTISQYVSYKLRLHVSGTDPVQLSVDLSGSQILSYTDSSSSRIYGGFAGLMHGTEYRTQYDNFVLSGSAPAFSGSAPPPPPPTDGGTGTPDGGTGTPDAGTGTPDAGMGGADAGTGGTDAGTGGTDAGSPPTETSFSDDFANCTSSGLGPDWITTGTWYCEVANEARGQTAGGLALANANLPDDQTVTARIELSEGGTGSGLVARATNGSFYLARMLESGSFEIDRVVGGTITPLGSAPQTFTEDSGSYRITLSVSGASPVQLTGSVNGNVLVTTTDNSADQLTSGAVGMYSGASVRTMYYLFSATASGSSMSAGPTPIGPVTNLTASGGSGQVGLSWVNPSGAYAATRIIQSATGYASSPTPSGDQTIVFDSAGTSTTVTGLAASTTYYYTAWARDTSGNYSATSATASATTASSGTTTGGGTAGGTSTTVNFSDSFSECTSTTDLGPNWTIVNGDWYCGGQKARGESATSLALANTAEMAGTDVTARVQFADPQNGGGGVAARASSDGTNYYAALGLTAGHVQLIRVNGSSVTVLGDVPESIAPEPSSYRIRLRVSGTSPVQLDVWWGGVQIMSVQDTASNAPVSGLSGLFNDPSTRGMYSGFSVTSF